MTRPGGGRWHSFRLAEIRQSLPPYEFPSHPRGRLAWLATPARALEIAADFHVPFTPRDGDPRAFSSTKKPVLTVKSGATVHIDGGPCWREDDPGQWLRENNIPGTSTTCPAQEATVTVLRDRGGRRNIFFTKRLLDGAARGAGKDRGEGPRENQ